MSLLISQPVAASGIKRLNQRHLRLVELYLAGMTRQDMAAATDMTPENVYLVTQSPFFQDEVARRRKIREGLTDSTVATQANSALAILKEAETEAAQRMRDLIKSPDEKIQFQASKDILDRAGFGRGQQAPAVHITAENMQVLVQAFQESVALGAQPSGVAALGQTETPVADLTPVDVKPIEVPTGG